MTALRIPGSWGLVCRIVSFARVVSINEKKQTYYYGLGAAACTSLAWGIEPIFLNQALSNYSSSFVSWFRFFFVVLGIATYLLLRGRISFTSLRNIPALALLASLFLAGNYYGFVTGMSFTGPAVATVLLQTGPFFLALFGWLFFREQLRNIQKCGILLSFAGFALFLFDRKLLVSEQISVSGEALVVLAGFCWAVYAAIQKKLSSSFDQQSLNVFVLGAASFLLLPPLFLQDSMSFASEGILALLLSGFCNLVAYFALAEGLKYAPATSVSLIVVCNPFITLFLSKLSEHYDLAWMPVELISFRGYAGVFFALSGILLVALFKPPQRG